MVIPALARFFSQTQPFNQHFAARPFITQQIVFSSEGL
jgi:hypothetical protein